MRISEVAPAKKHCRRCWKVIMSLHNWLKIESLKRKLDEGNFQNINVDEWNNIFTRFPEKICLEKERKRKGRVVEAIYYNPLVEARSKKKGGGGGTMFSPPTLFGKKKQNFKHGSNNCSVIQEVHGDVLKPNDRSILLLFLHVSSENFPSLSHTLSI